MTKTKDTLAVGSRESLLILGDQLFPLAALQRFKDMVVLMAEDLELCTRYKQHKHKLVLFLSAMRHYRDLLDRKGFRIDYVELNDSDAGEQYEDKLELFAKHHAIEKIHVFEVADRFLENRILRWCKKRDIELVEHPSPMFLTPRAEFDNYLRSRSRPFLRTFYEERRRHWHILMTPEGGPMGGRYSFDADNRKRLPGELALPGIPNVRLDETTRRVMRLVQDRFSDHPGDVSNFWLPVTRVGYLSWLRNFLEARLANFGRYQDAITRRDPFLFHSILSPGLNLGLILPGEIVKRAVCCYETGDAPLNSVEGFVRQVVGWREFVHGIHRHFGGQMESANHWRHSRRMRQCWYNGSTGLDPVDYSIHKAIRYGYCHHIERLMVLANIFNLSGIHPKEVYRWFMEMFVDSADWVMQANVYGMGLMSDGGIFATKPYISGSNYIRKMGDFPKGDWCDVWDGLYWGFVDRHRDFFEHNSRMSMAVQTLDKLSVSHRRRIFLTAEKFLDHATIES